MTRSQRPTRSLAASDRLASFRACAWPVASLPSPELEHVLSAANSHGSDSAAVATCQRVEVFHLQSCACAAPEHFDGFDALLRLAEVAAGLHSVVLGEEQILGQARQAVASAGATVRQQVAVAIAAARALRAETKFNAHTGHLLDRALRLSTVSPGGRVAVVGAGAVGRLVAERAVELGFAEVVVVARREPDARWFAAPMTFAPLSELSQLPPVDVLVTCLGSTAEPIPGALLPEVRHLVVDLGTPRNVDGCTDAPLLTIAGMMQDEHRHSDDRRARLRERLRELLLRRLAMESSTAASLPGRLRLEVERIRQDEAARIRRLHPDVPQQAIEAITRSLVNHLFHRPTERLRNVDDPALAELFVQLFAVEQPPAPEYRK